MPDDERLPAARVCGGCGSPNVDLWKSWNLVGEWVCDDCAPDDPAWLMETGDA